MGSIVVLASIQQYSQPGALEATLNYHMVWGDSHLC